MSSSLIETLNNAFARYDQLKICEIKQYDKSEGPPIDYIECHISNKAILE